MKEVKIEKSSTIIKYETSDGYIHDRKDRAELHEKAIEFKAKVDLLKHVDGAYYCETQEDFDSIVDWEAYRRPYYDFYSYTYKPCYEYFKSSFKGADWYFFEWEYNDNDADDYWVESLSEKKAEWEEFYNQFKMEK